MTESPNESSHSEKIDPEGQFEITSEMRRRNRITAAIILGVLFLYLSIGILRTLIG